MSYRHETLSQKQHDHQLEQLAVMSDVIDGLTTDNYALVLDNKYLTNFNRELVQEATEANEFNYRLQQRLRDADDAEDLVHHQLEESHQHSHQHIMELCDREQALLGQISHLRGATTILMAISLVVGVIVARIVELVF